MNSKTAKMLRRAAGYKNQTATPGVMDFPGVARMVKVPVFARHMTEKRGLRLDHDYRGKPIQELEINPETGLLGPKYEMIALSRPGTLRPKEPKGVYRALKRVARSGGFGPNGWALRDAVIAENATQ